MIRSVCLLGPPDELKKGPRKGPLPLFLARDIRCRIANRATRTVFRMVSGRQLSSVPWQKPRRISVGAPAPWKTFFGADIAPDEPIPHLLNAIDTAFGYTAYQDNKVKQTEVDDLTTQKRTWERAWLLATHDRRPAWRAGSFAVALTRYSYSESGDRPVKV